MQYVGAPPSGRTILRLVGSGGMGVVYEALDERLDRRVALKVLHPHLTMQGEMRDRLLAEARFAARVEHENVVRIYNVHEVDTGLCLEMQYVEGVPLTQLIAGRRLPPLHAVDLMQQVLEALAACHEKNVVHADLKPANLLVTRRGQVLLADFGISRAVFTESESACVSMAMSGPLWGTPQYCPPEAFSGEPPSVRWDLYALGVMVHEALSGNLPFAAETPALLIQEKLAGKRIPIREKASELSVELAALVDALLEEKPENRPVSAAATLAQLKQTPEYGSRTSTTRALRHNESAGTLPLSSLSPAKTHTTADAPGGLRQWAFVASAAVLFFVLGTVYAVYSRGGAPVGPTERPITPAVGSPGEVMELARTRDHVLFSYDDGRRGRELWAADHEGNVSIVADINPGPASSNPHGFLYGGLVTTMFIATSDTTGREPWVFGDIPPATRIIRDVVPGPMHSNPKPLAASEDARFLFYATSIDSGREIWITDLHPDRTGPLAHLYPDVTSMGTNHNPVRMDGDGLILVQQKREINRIMRYGFADGSVEELCQANGDIGDFVVLGGRYLFAARDDEVGYELWITDRKRGEKRLIKDIWPGTGSSDPTDFHVWNGAAYFRARTREHGMELWKSDGTPEGTVMVADLHAGAGDGSPSNFVGVSDRLFFRGRHEYSGLELWSTDGNPDSTPRLYDIYVGGESSGPYSMAGIGGHLIFSADDGFHGEELWALDTRDPEAEPFLVADIKVGPESSEPHALTPLGGPVGVFIYKAERGHGLMSVEVMGDDVVLTPYDPLPLK